ncbi:MAG: methylmalonyl-CoA epimerase [Saprospiraceae bacterium]
MMKIEHVGIAVKDLKLANACYHDLLGVAPYKEERVESESVITSFFKVGETKIELLQATSEVSAIAKFIQKRGEGLHHIAFEVEDIRSEMDRLKNKGYHIINEQPIRGADNKWVCFCHPKDFHGVLIELCQTIVEK